VLGENDVSEAYLKQVIEQLREQMVSLVSEKGSFVDERVVSLSQELDEYIVELQLIVRKKRLKASMKEAYAS
jgi:hypothetical protein